MRENVELLPNTLQPPPLFFAHHKHVSGGEDTLMGLVSRFESLVRKMQSDMQYAQGRLSVEADGVFEGIQNERVRRG
jgi:hypothetical protein